MSRLYVAETTLVENQAAIKEIIMSRTKEEEIQEFYNCLEDIASDAGDNLDRMGDYTSDKIRNLIKEFRERIRKAE